MIDEAYTAADHSFRESDDYAGAKYEITLRWLGPGAGRRLLNIGCGGGLFNTLAANAGFAVEACEPDPLVQAAAVAAAPTGVVVHLAGVFDAPFAPEADVVVMHDVLEHIQNERGAVGRLSDLVRPGGKLVISVPALPRLFGYHDELLGHYRRYSKRTIRAALDASFEIERLRYFGMSFIPVTAWYSTYRRQPYPTSKASGPSLLGRVFRLACRIESRVPTPGGTSLVCLAHRPPA
jgi:2-polyprenyl-3-methyl-5-hydroxy-6-metoxy-1,4-benzoquinol methylase